MQLILTHDQADFDAIGSLLGASLIHEGAVPVLPPRLNRNVRAFLNLYGIELPFIEQQDLTGELVHSIILVDTQSLVTVKGSRKNTPVRVIDHHSPKADAPANWSFTYDTIGACTSMFVEPIRDQNIPINPIQATLLLLGIYEDTGSLTYPSTTSRDVRAAAFLMDMGASLKVAAEYLNPPLSSAQRLLYDRLLDSANTLHIQGSTIILATGQADDMNEEISSIAHKIRDLLDPDALFLLVTTRDGVRLIARSTNDRIDVSQIASEFGGGGHERASAALIHPVNETSPEVLHKLMQETLARLESILPTYVQPTIRVRKIMSRRPLLISPETSTQEALALMQKYGYEGYPVVEDEKIVGLLTRRAVDRAISHRLNLPSSSLMEAGDFSVFPEDPIEKLQEIMTKTGWGQIPVVDPVQKKVIGIATRTDLLKTLRLGEASLPGHINLSTKLEASLPSARIALINVIKQCAGERRLPIYIVGGFVRDLIMNHPCEDFDIVVEGDAITLARTLCKKYGGRVVTHKRFGTAKWQISEIAATLAAEFDTPENVNPLDLPDSLDLISARKEFYEYPTALPRVERGSIKLDLHRRDFTINTMALRLDGRHYGELFDFWGGMTDLKQKLVRVLHSLSFVDDPTRLLRAVRFEQRFGFHIETRTLQLVKEARDLLKQISGDRLRHEFNLIFHEGNPPVVFKRLQELGLLEVIHPSLGWGKEQQSDWNSLFVDSSTGSKLPDMETNGWAALLVRLKPEELEETTTRLKLPVEITRILLDTARLQFQFADLSEFDISEVVKKLDRIKESSIKLFLQLHPDHEIHDLLEKYLSKWKHIQPIINGHDLEKMGIPHGPVYRDILDTLRKAWLNGEIHDPIQEQNFLMSLIQHYR